MMNREFLEKRNALWAALRQLEPDDPQAEALLQELENLIGWSRAKILAGLGWNDAFFALKLTDLQVLDLEDPRWQNLTVFFENDNHSPSELLRQWLSLVGSNQEYEFYQEHLFHTFLHQVTITNAAFAFVPWLVQVAQSGQSNHAAAYLVDVCLVEANRIVCGTHFHRQDTEEYPVWLMADYFVAIKKAAILADFYLLNEPQTNAQHIQLRELRPALDGNAELAFEQWCSSPELQNIP